MATPRLFFDHMFSCDRVSFVEPLKMPYFSTLRALCEKSDEHLPNKGLFKTRQPLPNDL